MGLGERGADRVRWRWPTSPRSRAAIRTAIASHVTADFWNEHTSALGRSGRGRVEYRRRLPAFLADFAGLRYDVEDVVAEGDRVVVAYTMRARWHGQDVAIRGVFRLRVEDGLVAHRADYWDGLDFQRQTGQTS